MKRMTIWRRSQIAHVHFLDLTQSGLNRSCRVKHHCKCRKGLGISERGSQRACNRQQPWLHIPSGYRGINSTLTIRFAQGIMGLILMVGGKILQSE